MSESRVIITADANRAVTEFQRFRTQAVGALDQVSKAGGIIGGVLGGIGATLSIAAFTGWIKTAIDATDAASDLSQKTGIAIEDLAGLELAFQKGGMEAGALEGSMSKLSKQIVDGNDAFDKLGVKTKGATGQLKTNKDMLYELADKFANMEDGVQKTALAQEIFGKSGAAMIPMLNEGSEGLREMDEMARKLGLSLSQEAVDKAGDFNDTLDLLALGSQGVARGIAAELLPTLSNLTGQFLTTMTSGDRLKNTASFLATGLKMLYTVAVGVVEVFSTIGKTVGAAGAQIVSLLQGNFSQAAEIGRQWQADVGDGWKATLASIEAAWSSAADGSVVAMTNYTRHATVVGKSAAELAAEANKATKAREEEAKVLAEVAGLTGSFAKEWDQLSVQYTKGRISLEQLTKAQANLLAKQPAVKAAADEEVAHRKAMTDAAVQFADAYDLAAEAKARALAGLQAQRDENEAIGLGAIELAELNAVRLESRAARAEENADIAEGLDLSGQLAQQYRDEAAALRALAGEQRQGARKKIAADEAKSAEEAWKRGAESIEKSLTDALLRGFESGQSIGKNIISTLKNMFSTLVLRPVISAVVNPVAGAVNGMLGMSTPAAAAGGGGGGGGVAGNVLSAAGSLFGAGGLSGSLMAGAGWLTGATTLTGSLTAATSLMATGTLGGIASGLGMVAGAMGPIGIALAAAVAIWKKLDTSGTYHTGGAAMATGGAVSTIQAESLRFERTRTNTETEKFVGALAGGVVSILDSAALAFGKTAGYTAATAFADDTSKDGAWGALVISKLGEKIVDWQDTRTSRWAPKEFANGEAGQKQYLEALSKSVRTALDGIGLPSWAKQMLDAVGEGAGLEELAKVVESINATQGSLKMLGEQLVGFAGLSDAAVSALMKAAGGIEALASGAGSFMQNYYTESEKAEAVTKQMTAALAAVGLQVPANRAEYRKLLEAQLALGEAGVPAVAALLRVQQVFADLHPEASKLADSTTDITDAAKAAADAQADARAVLTEAYDAEREAIEATMGRMRSFAGSLRTLRDSALLGSLSPLTPQQKYQEARAQYERTLAAARGGDETAQGRYAEAYQAFLEASQLVNASGAQYQRDFAYAQAATEEAIQWAERQVDVGQASLDALKAQVAGQVEVKKAVLSVTEAIKALAATMGAAGSSVVGASQTSALASLYQSILGRAPDVEGLKYWQERMAAGVSIGDIAKAFSSSSEALGTPGFAAPAALPDFSRMGTVDMVPLVSEIKRLNEEVARLRADAERQTGDSIQANAMAADSSAEKIAAATAELARVAAQSRETRVFPE